MHLEKSLIKNICYYLHRTYTIQNFFNSTYYIFLFYFKDLAAINELMRTEVQRKSKVGKRLLTDDHGNEETLEPPPAKMQLILPSGNYQFFFVKCIKNHLYSLLNINLILYIDKSFL